MRKSIVIAALAGTIAVSGAAAVPALAEGTTATTAAAATTTTPEPTATDGSTDARPSPQARITEVLKGLVTDGTLTQAQSDKVATTLADQLPKGGPGGHDGMRGIGIGKITTAAAKALGVSEADLRTELAAGKSVADVAKEKSVDLDTVVTAVTDAAKTQIAQAVTDGKITQARADTMTANLADKITEEVNEVHDGDHGGRGGRGGPFGGSGSGSTETPSEAAPTS